MSTPTVQSMLKVFGLPAYNPNDQYATIYPVVMKRNAPAKVSLPGFLVQGEAFLRSRTIAYQKQKPGDCGNIVPVGSKVTTGLQISQASLGGASAIGTLASGGAAAFAGTTLGAILGPATLGLSLAVIPITAVEQHHAVAVENEQSTLCKVTAAWNQTAGQIESMLRAGQISERDAATYIENLADNLVQGLDGIKKVCNAACSYQGFIRAYQDFCINFLYPDIENASIPQYDPSDSNPYSPASTTSVSTTIDATTSGPAAVSAGNLTDQSLTKLPPVVAPGPAPAAATVLAAPVSVANASGSVSGISTTALLGIAAAIALLFFVSR